MFKILKFGAGILVITIVAAAAYLVIAPPDILRVGTNYSAKIVCSNVFIAGRDAQEVLAVDVQAPGHPLLKQISIDVNPDTQIVTAKIFGFFATATSKYREGLGCTNVHDAKLSNYTLEKQSAPDNTLWPQGNSVNPSQDPKLLEILSNKELLGQGYRAVVVVKDGRIVGETYAEGFDADTPLLGWSMTKTVTAAIIGTLIKSGKMSLDDNLNDSYPEWASDTRKDVKIKNMLAMSSGLKWNEAYGSVSDVTRMLFLNDDMSGFGSRFELESKIDSAFVYSSGTSTMLARVWQDTVGASSLNYPQEQLFKPLGITSAVMETDAKDTFIGSSYMYATGRDWARFGQFLLQRGFWNNQQILPIGFADWMFEPVEVSDGIYTKGHMWRRVTGSKETFEDAVWMSGHDGQSVGILPSRRMVIVRLGLTPSKLGYSPLKLTRELVGILRD